MEGRVQCENILKLKWCKITAPAANTAPTTGAGAAIFLLIMGGEDVHYLFEILHMQQGAGGWSLIFDYHDSQSGTGLEGNGVKVKESR